MCSDGWKRPSRMSCSYRRSSATPQPSRRCRFTGSATQRKRYLPNGNSRGDEGFAYKLAWMDRLADRAQALLDEDRALIITGDFNVCPTDDDYAPGALSPTDAFNRPETRSRYRRLLWMGLTDAIRAIHPHDHAYTFWDYQAGAWQRDMGLRIDHALLSPTLAERLVAADPDKQERDQPQPSDHVPVVIDLH